MTLIAQATGNSAQLAPTATRQVTTHLMGVRSMMPPACISNGRWPPHRTDHGLYRKSPDYPEMERCRVVNYIAAVGRRERLPTELTKRDATSDDTTEVGQMKRRLDTIDALTLAAPAPINVNTTAIVCDIHYS